MNVTPLLHWIVMHSNSAWQWMRHHYWNELWCWCTLSPLCNGSDHIRSALNIFTWFFQICIIMLSQAYPFTFGFRRRCNSGFPLFSTAFLDTLPPPPPLTPPSHIPTPLRPPRWWWKTCRASSTRKRRKRRRPVNNSVSITLHVCIFVCPALLNWSVIFSVKMRDYLSDCHFILFCFLFLAPRPKI